MDKYLPWLYFSCFSWPTCVLAKLNYLFGISFLFFLTSLILFMVFSLHNILFILFPHSLNLVNSKGNLKFWFFREVFFEPQNSKWALSSLNFLRFLSRANPFFKLIYFNWRLITLQYCGFCHTLTWISHRCSHPVCQTI